MRRRSFSRGSPAAPRVISPENAFLIYDMMRDVIRRGTGRRARDLGRADIAGKTGTSNERRDAWFSGFNGALVATAWVGFDQERSLGAREEGGQTALPMWKYFMARALRRTPGGAARPAAHADLGADLARHRPACGSRRQPAPFSNCSAPPISPHWRRTAPATRPRAARSCRPTKGLISSSANEVCIAKTQPLAP